MPRITAKRNAEYGREFLVRCAQIAGGGLGEGAFSPGPAIWAGRREIAHFDADGTLDVRLTKQQIRAHRTDLEADRRISFRAHSSDLLAIAMRTPADEDDALALVVQAVAANAPSAP